MSDEVTELEKQIRYHQKLYYNDEPEISDAEFDALWDRLLKIDPKNDLFTKKVGEDDHDMFDKMDHIIPMGSQQKASNEKEITKWCKKMPFNTFIVEPKCDGISIELQYKDGKLTYAITRGDGKKGDNITDNVVKMGGCVKSLDPSFTGAVRGEILMSHKVFDKKYAKTSKNPRNMASGIAKRKDGDGSDDLFIKVYDAQYLDDDKNFTHETDKMKWLADQGFDVVSMKIFTDDQEIIEYRNDVSDNLRDKMDYDIDGLVIKGIDIDLDDMKRARPMKQIAFKFPTEKAVSTLIDVEWSTNGKNYTPVGIVEPVELAGTTVRRASLANPNLIKDMGLRLNQKVMVSKRGDIIPKIEKVVMTTQNDTDIPIPTECEVCGTTLINEGINLYCPNPACDKVIYRRLKKWIQKLEIKDFGDLILKQLFDKGIVTEIADLYALKVSDLTQLDRVGEKSAKKALNNLNAVTEITLAKFVAGFDIDGVGERSMKKVVIAGITKLSDLKKVETKEKIEKINGLGPHVANLVYEGVNALYDQMINVYKTKKLHVGQPKDASDILKGKSFCFTGKLHEMTRKEAQELVEKNGGTTKSGVSSNLDFLVTNTPDSGSSKNTKAEKFGTRIITEKQFLTMVTRKTPKTQKKVPPPKQKGLSSFM